LYASPSNNSLPVGVSKKTEQLIKSRKLIKNNRKNRTEKNPIKLIKILKKSAVSVRFYKQKTEKPEPNQNWKKPRKKPSQTGKTEKTEPKPRKTEPNRFEPVFSIKNRTEPKPVGLTRFRFFLKKKFRFGYFFW